MQELLPADRPYVEQMLQGIQHAGLRGLAFLGGDMSVVYRANSDAGPVTVKFPHPAVWRDRDDATRDRLYAQHDVEAFCLDWLSGPKSLRFHCQGEIEGVPYLAVEYVQGITLGEALQAADSDRLLRFARQILGASMESLEWAHVNSIAHRDASVNNIVIDPTTCVGRLIDYGIAEPFEFSRLIQRYNSKRIKQWADNRRETRRAERQHPRDTDRQSAALLILDLFVRWEMRQQEPYAAVITALAKGRFDHPHLRAPIPPAIGQLIARSVLQPGTVAISELAASLE